MPRTKGSKTGIRHTPHPLIQIHKQEYVKTLEDFCECIFPRNSFEVAKVLEAIKQGKMGYGKIQTTAEELGIDSAKFASILRRLRDLGILTRTCTFSDVFEDKITAIATFYSEYTGKANPVQGALDDANAYLRSKKLPARFEPQFKMAEEKEQEDPNTENELNNDKRL